MQAHYSLIAIALGLGMFLSMMASLELGRRLGVRYFDRPGSRAGVGAVDGTVYSLVALLIGFSFNGAASRFDARRSLVNQEVTSASTAWHRLEMLPADRQTAARRQLLDYVDAVIAAYTASPASTDLLGRSVAVTRAQNALWQSSVAVSLTPEGEKARVLVLTALDELFSAVEKERLARRVHAPMIIFVMLGLTALVGALFVGYAMATREGRNWIYMIGIAATISSAVYVIIELEYPRLGLVRIDTIDEALIELRATLR